MADEQESEQAKQKTNSAPALVTGFMLLVVAISVGGPLQWLLYGGAVGLFLYAIIAGKAAKKKS